MLVAGASSNQNLLAKKSRPEGAADLRGIVSQSELVTGAGIEPAVFASNARTRAGAGAAAAAAPVIAVRMRSSRFKPALNLSQHYPACIRTVLEVSKNC